MIQCAYGVQRIIHRQVLNNRKSEIHRIPGQAGIRIGN